MNKFIKLRGNYTPDNNLIRLKEEMVSIYQRYLTLITENISNYTDDKEAGFSLASLSLTIT